MLEQDQCCFNWEGWPAPWTIIYMLVAFFSFCILFCCTDLKYQWSQIPKMHYQEHISEDCCFLNPERVWCYPGEHLVGNATRLASACLAGLPPWQVSTTVCLKYQIGFQYCIEFEPKINIFIGLQHPAMQKQNIDFQKTKILKIILIFVLFFWLCFL